MGGRPEVEIRKRDGSLVFLPKEGQVKLQDLNVSDFDTLVVKEFEDDFDDVTMGNPISIAEGESGGQVLDTGLGDQDAGSYIFGPSPLPCSPPASAFCSEANVAGGDELMNREKEDNPTAEDGPAIKVALPLHRPVAMLTACSPGEGLWA
eukprot:352209-Hanusia_phi.AAC.9